MVLHTVSGGQAVSKRDPGGKGSQQFSRSRYVVYNIPRNQSGLLRGSSQGLRRRFCMASMAVFVYERPCKPRLNGVKEKFHEQKKDKRLKRLRVVDSHTGGEPTRIIVSGGPALAARTMAERLEEFRREHDYLRHALVNEPRGSEVIVGALLCEPANAGSAAGVIYFNNVGYLGMCVHGTIGLVVTLSHLGRIGAGMHQIESPVGTVAATLHGTGEVTVDNVPSFRHLRDVAVEVPGHGEIRGDVAWGG